MGRQRLQLRIQSALELIGGKPPRADDELACGKFVHQYRKCAPSAGCAFLFSFVCAAGPCGFGILRIDSFFVFADGAREDPPRPGPPGRLQAAQGRSCLGNPPSDVRTVSFLHLCSMGYSKTADETSFIAPIQRMITGASSRMSGTDRLVARSRQLVLLVRVSPYSFAVARHAAERVRPAPLASHHPLIFTPRIPTTA